MANSGSDATLREQLQTLRGLATFRPAFSAGIVGLGALVATFEGVGLSFIYPIMRVAQTDGPVEPTDPIMEGFLTAYELLGVPFSLEALIIGIGIVMTIRFSASFLVAWLRAVLRRDYEESLRTQAFDAALDAEVGYFDEAGSDDILNAIITETRYSGKAIKNAVLSVETLFLVVTYLAIMVYIATEMTLFAIALLGGITYLIRHIVEPGYTVGSRVAQANERVQQAVQAGTQGIRDVKLFRLSGEVFTDFQDAMEQYTRSSIELQRNKAALLNGYDLAAALSLFVLIYIGFVYSGLSLGALGIFLFAMFRLSPLASRLNAQVYNLEGNLSHVVRTREFIARLQARDEDGGSRSVSSIDRVQFDDVSFAYGEEEVLQDVSFEVERGEFVAFVGQSGAGKSTIVSLLTRMYEPGAGEIRGDGVPIEEYRLDEWRARLAVVRQNPYIFNDTLERNVTVGNRAASREAVERACEIARVDEFLGELPDGYESLLGDDGVRLSGGQRQRVALARALLTDADFLVLDEATSDLDSNLEREVQEAIESMERDYAILAIAHRLSTVQNADRIYTLESGRIAEVGDHSELVDRGGKYAELHAIQSHET